MPAAIASAISASRSLRLVLIGIRMGRLDATP